MNKRQEKLCRESRVVKTARVFPQDTNNHNTLFGGKLMSYIDDIASISATKHSRCDTVTASTDSVDFLLPIGQGDSVTLVSYVSWTGKTSMEIFVKIIKENLKTGKRELAATSFLTFVALDPNGRPKIVPKVVPETDEEKMIFNTGEQRSIERINRKKQSKALAKSISESLNNPSEYGEGCN